tara:strand:+ start:229 stop:1338 length:1110 start_codon:yes stop_codon:yes gene_type:complete
MLINNLRQNSSFAFLSFLSIVLITVITFIEYGFNTSVLFFIGIFLGITFIVTSFGFSSGWAIFFKNLDSSSIIKQLILITLTSLLIIPTVHFFDSYSPTIAPLSISLLVGSFMFGIGMQLSNGCASGTLFSVGSSNLKMIIVLIFFIIGAFVGSLILPQAINMGSIKPVLIGNNFNLPYKLLINISILILVIYIFFKVSKKKVLISLRDSLGILTISTLCLLCLLFSGYTWGITFGFTVWGGKLWNLMGGEISSFIFWTWSRPSEALEKPILSEVSSLMNIGMILGSLSFVAVTRKIKVIHDLTIKKIILSIIGGLLMGIGARLAFGCNIGAFLGGISSGSLHGWVWFVFAFFGGWVGFKINNYLKLNI